MSDEDKEGVLTLGATVAFISTAFLCLQVESLWPAIFLGFVVAAGCIICLVRNN